MTLARQLILGVSALFFLLLAGVEAIYLENSRVQLQGHLATQAQDAATSLAVRFAAIGTLEDRVLVETLVNPVFDRGYFREILVVSADGETLVRRELAAAQGDVPAWFTRLFPIDAPGAQAFVNSGWRETGRVIVVSHPNFAYQQLWHSGLQTIIWLLIVYALALAAITAFLAMLLRPLRAIERAAVAIGARDFQTIDIVPRARELAQVVAAMNGMAERIRRIIAEESARAEGMRREAFVDPVTALYNRRGFQDQLQSLIRSRGDVFSCALAHVEIRDLARYNETAGFQHGDELLAALAQTLKDSCAGHAFVCGRLGGAAFAIAAINVEAAALHALIASVCSRVGALLADHGGDARMHFSCGATRCEGVLAGFPALLAAADHALQRARDKGEDQYEIETFDALAAGGSQAWKALVAGAIDEDRLALYAQDVIGIPGGRPVHREVTVRMIREGGEPVSAMQFLPMTARHGLMPRLDCRVVARLLEHLHASGPATISIALNVSARSIADAAATRTILDLLDARPQLAGRLIFEMTEFGALQDQHLTQRFGSELRRRGARFALDNFAMQQQSLMLVHSLRPHYIKLSPVYSHNLASDTDSRFLVASIVRIVRSLDIGIYAQAIENDSILPLLEELGFSGYQGYATAKPARIA